MPTARQGTGTASAVADPLVNQVLDWLNSFTNVDERDKMKLGIPCNYPAKFHEAETENNL
tara:strand:- start:264 stop:443 length:180 start_codon:yes stop_codon:yes gene_type:complete